MPAENRVRRESGGGASVDRIQACHEQVFDAQAGVSSYAWTPDYYLKSFSTLSERQEVSLWQRTQPVPGRGGAPSTRTSKRHASMKAEKSPVIGSRA